MHPSVNLILLHCIKYMTELLLVTIGILFGGNALETVKFLIIKIEIFPVEVLLAVRMPSATASFTTAMVMMFLGDLATLSEPPEQETNISVFPIVTVFFVCEDRELN